MRRVIELIQRGATLLLVIFVFTNYWNPYISTKIESALIAGTKLSQNESSVKHLIPVTQKATGNEIFSTFTANPTTELRGTQVITTDARVLALRQFLIDYHSPLYPYADVFVREADEVGLDWRLIVSISGVESAFGNLIPPGSNNGWGWKGDPTQAWSHFNSWTEAISVITERMAIGYGTDLTPYDIEATYCPPCGLNPAHAWANGVQYFMNELNEYVDRL